VGAVGGNPKKPKPENKREDAQPRWGSFPKIETGDKRLPGKVGEYR